MNSLSKMFLKSVVADVTVKGVVVVMVKIRTGKVLSIRDFT